MAFVWDEVKEELFRFECDTLVSASAGTGKTAALVELYLRITDGRTALGNGVTPQNILALTFTRKAAGEMRERLREAFLARRRENPENAHYARMLDQLNDAVIGTFDSFCMRLLREHHFEAGLPLDFTLLLEDDARRLLLDCANKVLRRELAQGHPGLLLLLDGSSFEQVRGDLLSVVRASEILSGPPPDFEAEKEALPATIQAGIDAYGAVLEHVKSFVSNGGSTTKNFRAGFEALLANFEIYGAADKRPGADTSRRDGTAYFSGPNGILRTFKRINANSWKGELKAFRAELLAHLEAAQYAFERIFALDEARAAFDLAVAIRSEYAQAKAGLGVLDFEDTLKGAIEILRLHIEIRRQWQSRFDVILVDEFQDTNQAQLKLIELLSRDKEFSGNDGRPTRRLFVGDRKQSIYRFRGADVSVFRKIESDWKQRSDAKILHFKRNFRSSARLIDFSNALFGRLLNDGAQDYQSSYSPDDDLQPGLEHSGDETAVELLRIDGGVLSHVDERLRAEAETVAQRLQQMIVMEGVEIGPPGNRRKATFEDVAVLVRKKNGFMPAFEQAFRRAGLPFTVVDGSGLFERSEVLDLVAAARLLIEPWNLTALLTVLRSPAVHLSDNALFRLNRHCRSNALPLESIIKSIAHCRTLCNDAGVPAEQSRRLLHFVEVYHDLTRRRRLMPASEIFEELLERLDLEAVAACAHESERALANQQKLLRMLRENEVRSGSGDLYAALRRLDAIMQDQRGAAEAPQRVHGIQLMTIHQSKGLEFPIVVLPSVEIKSGAFYGRLLADKNAGIIARTRSKLADDPFQEHKENHKNMNLAEERRIYYVAATRARERLIIGGAVSSRKSASGEDEAETAELSMVDEIVGAAAVCGMSLRIHEVSSGVSLERLTLEAASAPDAAEVARLCAAAVPQTRHASMLGTFSVSMLHDFRACERRYHLKRMLERSTNLWIEAPYADDDNPEGASMGLLVHRFLETWPPGAVPKPGDISAFFAAVADDEREAAARAVRSLEHYFSSDYYAGLAQQVADGAKLHREMPFIAELELSSERRARLKGRIDLLVEPPQGPLRLIDYKYARSDTPKAADYLVQVAVYALALQRAWPGRRVDAEIVYLAGRGETVRVESGSPQAVAAIAQFEENLTAAHSRAELPYSQWRSCAPETCRSDVCRFLKLCGIEAETAG